MLSSRLDPPLSLPRLRLEGRMHELRVKQLCFSRDETGELLTTLGVHLDPVHVAALFRLTGGWPAALRLAAIPLRRTQDPGAVLAAFTGDERSVAEYLIGEILSGLSPDLRQFLDDISVCDDFPPDLATHLSGREDAAQLLLRLERETAVVARIDGRSAPYRMQPLLRTYLRADLERGQPRRMSALHDRAAAWWIDGNDPVQALAHLSAAGNRLRIVELLHRFGPQLVVMGAHELVGRVLDQIGYEERDRDPWLALSAALCHLETGELPAAQAALRQAERHWPAEAPSALAVLHRAASSILARWSGRILAEFPAGRACCRDPSVDEPAVRALAGLADAVDGLSCGPSRHGARSALAATQRLAHHHGWDYLAMQCRTMEATYAARNGDYRSASATSATALASAAAHGWLGSVWVGSAHAMLAGTALLGANPVAARQHAIKGLQARGSVASPAVRCALRTLHGCADFDLGQRAAGLHEMQQARIDVADSPLLPQQVARIGLLEVQAALALGRSEAAAQGLAWLLERAGPCGEADLIKAWIEIGLGQPESARLLLAPALSPAANLLPSTSVEALLAEAECDLGTGMRAAAVQAVQDALIRGNELDLVRPFVLAGPAVRALLLAGRDATNELGSFVNRALGAHRLLRQPDATRQLSEREQAVLVLLPSLLTLEEIAEDLLISVNTVKSHLRAVYLKLGVSSRRAAVVAARERELLIAGPHRAG